MKLRLVRVTLSSGVFMVGLVPATVNDAELTAMGEGAQVEFSAARDIPQHAPIGRVMARIAAATALEPGT